MTTQKTIGEFVAKAQVAIGRINPGLSYDEADFHGFVSGTRRTSTSTNSHRMTEVLP